ncbi:MAG: TatD family hydrolase [Polyangiales bacterium]
MSRAPDPPPPLAGVIDSHCHLDPGPRAPSASGGVEAIEARVARRDSPSTDELLARGRAAGIAGFVVVGVGETPHEARHAVATARAHRDVVAAIGVHPHDARLADEATVAELELLAADPRVVAVGEIGLDFHYDRSPHDVQRAVFRRFVAVARAVRKPIVIHTRSAGQEALAILEEEGARDLGGVIHCFSEDVAFARRALDLGFDLSFSGIVTFKTATAIQEVARMAPAERILVETDAPYLAPVPQRGKTCEPAMVVHTARFLAGLRGVTPEELARVSADNTLRRFPALRS